MTDNGWFIFMLACFSLSAWGMAAIRRYTWMAGWAATHLCLIATIYYRMPASGYDALGAAIYLMLIGMPLVAGLVVGLMIGLVRRVRQGPGALSSHTLALAAIPATLIGGFHLVMLASN